VQNDRVWMRKNDERISWKNWKLTSLSKLILKINKTGNRGRAKIKTLSSGVNMFIKHITNDITKYYVTTNI